MKKGDFDIVRFIKKHNELITYVVFVIIMLFHHIRMTISGDDQIFIEEYGGLSFIEIIKHCWDFNGRIFTDGFSIIVLHLPFLICMLIDVLIWLFVALLIKYIFLEKKSYGAFLVVALLLIFPLNYLNSTGYIAGFSNYFYTITCMLMALCVYKYTKKRNKYKYVLIALTMVPILYATNHDQSAVVFIVGYLTLILYKIVTKRKDNIGCAVFQFLVGVCGYLIYFLSPGHMARQGQSGGAFDTPGFENWNIIDKIYNGYTSSVATIIFMYTSIYFVFTLFVFLMGIRNDKDYVKVISCIPIGVELFELFTGYNWFIYTELDWMYPMFNLKSEFPGLFLSFIVIASIFIVIYKSMPNLDKWIVILFLVLGSGSRIMMGFASTLYGSGFRTFILFSFCLVICTVLICKELFEKEKYHVETLYAILCLVAIYNVSYVHPMIT